MEFQYAVRNAVSTQYAVPLVRSTQCPSVRSTQCRYYAGVSSFRPGKMHGSNAPASHFLHEEQNRARVGHPHRPAVAAPRGEKLAWRIASAYAGLAQYEGLSVRPCNRDGASIAVPAVSIQRQLDCNPARPDEACAHPDGPRCKLRSDQGAGSSTRPVLALKPDDQQVRNTSKDESRVCDCVFGGNDDG